MIRTIKKPNAAFAAVSDFKPKIRRFSVEGSGTG
jgi:hypothetical protein